MSGLAVGQEFRKQRILDSIRLSDGRYLIKTKGEKSEGDFRVRLVYQVTPTKRSMTPKHAHFAIDLYGKVCSDKAKGIELFRAIIGVWQGLPVTTAIEQYALRTESLPGYALDYILHAMNWILKQEDINFSGRPIQKQSELDLILAKMNVGTPEGRLGSQLAISLLCDIAHGEHPVEALMRANLDVIPAKRARGAR